MADVTRQRHVQKIHHWQYHSRVSNQGCDAVQQQAGGDHLAYLVEGHLQRTRILQLLPLLLPQLLLLGNASSTACVSAAVVSAAAVECQVPA
jgi:hypothetical protein